MMFMVNDNVRYAGAAISADLILSKIAEDIGFHIDYHGVMRVMLCLTLCVVQAQLVKWLS